VLLTGSCDASAQSAAATPSSRERGAASFSLTDKSAGEGAASTSLGQSRRGYLSFSERVAYEYAIEEVRWRHRIWPKDNPEPKPPLDAVISREAVEKKVTEYLEKSQALADHWQQPITAEQLLAEMERMASQTRQPDVLRELFAALGNDPFVVAECLARPILADRLVSEIAHYSEDSQSRTLPSARNPALSAIAPYQTAYKLPEIAPLDCADDSWTATSSVNVPDGRYYHTAVWTGSEIIVWGGFDATSGTLNTGGRYSPVTDSWTATSTVNLPTRRCLHSAVWTGREVIVWGGQSPSFLNTGGRYNPTTDSWAPTSIINAPAARIHHTAVWTGREMIVWGGINNFSVRFNDGGRYNPSTDSWIATSTLNAPLARFGHSALWTGSMMIIWSGSDSMRYVRTGGKYNPSTDSWTPTSIMNAPPGRYADSAIWTGGEVIVWGGVDETFNDCNTGGRYNPSTDSWVATNLANVPVPRDSHSAIWTGSDMIVWGGYRYPPGEALDSGGKYNPTDNSWIATSTANVPLARWNHTAVWIGSEMIVWGGVDINVFELNTGGGYCAQPSTPLVQSAVSRKTHGSAGDFDIPVPLNGTPGIECRSGGTTNDYTLVVTFLANVSVSGNPQAAVTSGVGTIGSGGVSNGGRVIVADNVVTIPLTNVGNAQAIQVTLYGVNGTTDFEIPMSILIGDTTGNGTVNAGDVGQAKSRVAQQVNTTNFRADVNADGYIDAGDIGIVKSNAGTGLP